MSHEERFSWARIGWSQSAHAFRIPLPATSKVRSLCGQKAKKTALRASGDFFRGPACDRCHRIASAASGALPPFEVFADRVDAALEKIRRRMVSLAPRWPEVRRSDVEFEFARQRTDDASVVARAVVTRQQKIIRKAIQQARLILRQASGGSMLEPPQALEEASDGQP